jgi:hypothetical protein
MDDDAEQLRVKTAVLKRAVKDSLRQVQDLTAQLQQKDVVLRQKEGEVRKALEDADNLQFHNNRLSKRVEQLLEEVETLVCFDFAVPDSHRRSDRLVAILLEKGQSADRTHVVVFQGHSSCAG